MEVELFAAFMACVAMGGLYQQLSVFYLLMEKYCNYVLAFFVISI